MKFEEMNALKVGDVLKSTMYMHKFTVTENNGMMLKLVAEDGKEMKIMPSLMKGDSPYTLLEGETIEVAESVQHDIPEWILQKNLTEEEFSAVRMATGVSQKRETEKAILFQFDTKFGSVETWVPKSLLGGK